VRELTRTHRSSSDSLPTCSHGYGIALAVAHQNAVRAVAVSDPSADQHFAMLEVLDLNPIGARAPRLVLAAETLCDQALEPLLAAGGEQRRASADA
jgi:hypothetical protein